MGNLDQLHTVRLAEPVHLGACVAHKEGLPTLFVRGGAPGELVEVRITKKQRKIAWAQVERVIEPSPHRIAQVEIPGADLSYLDAPYVREWKREVLMGQLRRVGSAELAQAVQELYGKDGPQVCPTPGDAGLEVVTNWRTRADFAVLDSGQLAMRAYRSHDLIPLDEWPPLAKEFEDAGVFVETSWRERLRGRSQALLTAPNSGPRVVADNQIWDLQGDPGEGETVSWTVQVGGDTKSFDVDIHGFWQVHREAPEVLVQTVLQFADLRGNEIIVELYSGSGLFTYFLGKQLTSGHIATMEQSNTAVSGALRNCEGLPVTAFVGDVTPDSVSEIFANAPKQVDLVVLDPPRAGMGIPLATRLAELSAAKIILVSCDPAACARDVNTLMKLGYEVTNMSAWDIFPHTHHFEVVTALERR